LSFYLDNLKLRLTQIYERVCRQPPERGNLKHETRPLPLRRKDNRTRYHYCVKRRQGYLVIFDTDDFVGVSLPDHKATPEQLEQLEEFWERSLAWPPIQVQAKYEDGTWAMMYNLNPGVAQFLQSKGVTTLRIQLYETVDVPASNEKRAALESNLLGFNGKPITPIETAITL